MKKDFCLNECRMNDTYKSPNRWIDVCTAQWLHPAKTGLFLFIFVIFTLQIQHKVDSAYMIKA